MQILKKSHFVNGQNTLNKFYMDTFLIFLFINASENGNTQNTPEQGYIPVTNMYVSAKLSYLF